MSRKRFKIRRNSSGAGAGGYGIWDNMNKSFYGGTGSNTLTKAEAEAKVKSLNKER